jgi:hypothetical protein
MKQKPEETIFETEHRLKRSAKAVLEIEKKKEKQKIKKGATWINIDDKTRVLRKK